MIWLDNSVLGSCKKFDFLQNDLMKSPLPFLIVTVSECHDSSSFSV